MSTDNISKQQLDIEWMMIGKIMDFSGEYLFKSNWGTINDWCKYLNWKSPTYIYVINFVNHLIGVGILEKNGKVIKDNKQYEKYVLTKDYEKRMRELVIEQTEVYKLLDRWYDIYVP